MANFFTRALDRVTPWNRGGELVRRKKREEEQAQQRQQTNPTMQTGLRVSNSQPQQRVIVEGQQLPKPQQPVNIFETLNKNLVLNKPQTTVPVLNNQNNQPAQVPKPGTVVQPTVKVAPVQNKTLLMPNGQRAADIPDTPEIIINRGLDAGKSFEDIARENNFKIEGVREYAGATRPNYGIKLERPKQGFGNRIRDVFDTNTESDKFRRQEGNKVAVKEGRVGDVKDLTLDRQGNIASRTPIIGHVTKMLNTGEAQLNQVANVALADQARREFNAANEEWQKAKKSGDRDRFLRAEDRVTKAQQRVDYFNKEQEGDYGRFRKNDGGLFNAGTLYDSEASKRGDAKTALTDIVLPTAVTALDIYTLGQGAAIEQAIKTGGIKVLPTVAPNIVKAAAGNYASGDLGARAEGATGWDPIKSGAINAGFGTVGDIALPAATSGFKGKILPKIFKGRRVPTKLAIEELDDSAIAASAEAANEALRPRPISVTKNIPIEGIEGLTENINVRNLTEPGRLIQEIGGDAATATPNPLIKKLAEDARESAVRDAAFDQAKVAARPDPRIEGVTPTNTGNTGLFTRAEIDAEQAALDDALVNKEITKPQHKAASKELDELTAVDDAPKGQKIAVQTPDTIPVTENINVPTNLPETPGTVRVTQATAPNNVKSAAVAAQTPAPILPKEVQDVLDNPKQFNKRQVAAARNQRKLARAMAKTQEDTAVAMDRIRASETNPGAGQPEGFAPTGEFRRGKRGNVSESASAATEAQAGAREMADRSVDDLLDEVYTKETLSPGDRRRISAAKENLMKADPEGFRSSEKYRVLDNLEKAGRSDLGRGLALIPRTIRKTANADALVGRWERKVANVLDDPSKLTDGQWKRVQAVNDAFTTARDRAGQLEEQFRKTGSEADYNAWEKAHKAARAADSEAKMTEVKVAQEVLKGEKGINVTKTLDAMKKEADVNTMDFISANMLSGTGTGVRNTVGTELAGLENRLFANTRAKVTNKLFDTNVGGFDRKSARYGRKLGVGKWVDDIKARASVGGKNPIEWGKNWATAINSGGESSLQSQVYSRLGKYYRNQFADEGLSGKSLDLRMKHAMITDPDNMADVYLDATMKSSGLTGMFEKGQTIEKAVADYLGGKTDSKLVQGGSKLIMRMLVGFPTATGNFVYQSGKRLALGVPSYMEMGVKLAKGDKRGAALAFERGLKETGSGAAVFGMGVGLGKADMISGAYPSDPEERERWERDGRSENSIKINGAWYPIPQGAGMFGLPLLLGAAVGREGDSNESVKEMFTRKNLGKLLPTDQIQGALNTLTDNGESPQALKNMVASTVRAGTPVGALLNQISKSFDETKNDTTTKDFWSNVMDQIYSGIPGVNNMMNIPDKLDAEGNVITNPNALELALGASSNVQEGGEARSAAIDAKITSAVDKLDQYGLLGDTNLDGVLEGTALEAYNKAKTGKQLDKSDEKALKEGLVKGVSSEGTDTAYLEREQYDTNLAVLKLKRDLMTEDKTVKPSSLKDVDNAIKRGQVYKDNKIPYDLISSYQSIGVEDWRKMGIGPEDDDYDPDLYNPEMYQKLYDIDQLLTKAGVSYKKGALDKNKYFVKEKKEGSGGRGGVKQLDTSFGTLKDMSFAPKTQQYDSIDMRSGSVPIIRTVRPNIVHKITSSR